MQVLLIPGNGKTRRTRLTRRGIAFLAAVVVALPLTGGAVGYYLSAQRAAAPWVDDALAELRQSLSVQKQQVAQARQYADDHLAAITLRLGRMQSQFMRINGLGQRLVDMAGLDKGEFDFAEDPALGGPAPRNGAERITDPRAMIDGLSRQIDAKLDELTLLEVLLMDRELRAELNPEGWPVDGGYVSSGYGYRRDPFTGRRGFHGGVDIVNKQGTPVRSVAAGVVTFAGDKSGYGLVVEINHGNGYETRYAHALESQVKVGERVEKGQQIALVGSTGRSTGPHLHFEILRDGRAINPRKNLGNKRKR